MRPRFRVQVFEIGGAKPLHFVTLLAIGTDDADAGERFLDHGAEVGELLLYRLEAAVDFLSEVTNADRDERQRREGDERQPGVDRQHQDDGDDEGENGAGRVHDRRPDHHPHRIEIVGGTRHQVARAGGLVILQRHLEEVPEERVPQVVLDVARGANQDPAHEESEYGADARDPEEQAGIQRQLGAGDADVQVVDRVFEDPGR